jgi:hypothetical protein
MEKEEGERERRREVGREEQGQWEGGREREEKGRISPAVERKAAAAALSAAAAEEQGGMG